MSPLVFALLFIVAECLVAVFAVCLVYVRMKSRIDEIHGTAHVPNRLELAGRLIDACAAVQKTAGEPGSEQMLGGTGRQMVIETLRGLAGRLAAGDSVSPLFCDEVIRLCTDLAGVAPAPVEEPEPESAIPVEPVFEPAAGAAAEPAAEAASETVSELASAPAPEALAEPPQN